MVCIGLLIIAVVVILVGYCLGWCKWESKNRDQRRVGDVNGQPAKRHVSSPIRMTGPESFESPTGLPRRDRPQEERVVPMGQLEEEPRDYDYRSQWVMFESVMKTWHKGCIEAKRPYN